MLSKINAICSNATQQTAGENLPIWRTNMNKKIAKRFMNPAELNINVELAQETNNNTSTETISAKKISLSTRKIIPLSLLLEIMHDKNLTNKAKESRITHLFSELLKDKGEALYCETPFESILAFLSTHKHYDQCDKILEILGTSLDEEKKAAAYHQKKCAGKNRFGYPIDQKEADICFTHCYDMTSSNPYQFIITCMELNGGKLFSAMQPKAFVTEEYLEIVRYAMIKNMLDSIE